MGLINGILGALSGTSARAFVMILGINVINNKVCVMWEAYAVDSSGNAVVDNKQQPDGVPITYYSFPGMTQLSNNSTADTVRNDITTDVRSYYGNGLLTVVFVGDTIGTL